MTLAFFLGDNPIVYVDTKGTAIRAADLAVADRVADAYHAWSPETAAFRDDVNARAIANQEADEYRAGMDRQLRIFQHGAAVAFDRARIGAAAAWTLADVREAKERIAAAILPVILSETDYGFGLSAWNPDTDRYAVVFEPARPDLGLSRLASYRDDVEAVIRHLAGDDLVLTPAEDDRIATQAQLAEAAHAAIADRDPGDENDHVGDNADPIDWMTELYMGEARGNAIDHITWAEANEPDHATVTVTAFDNAGDALDALHAAEWREFMRDLGGPDDEEPPVRDRRWDADLDALDQEDDLQDEPNVWNITIELSPDLVDALCGERGRETEPADPFTRVLEAADRQRGIVTDRKDGDSGSRGALPRSWHDIFESANQERHPLNREARAFWDSADQERRNKRLAEAFQKRHPIVRERARDEAEAVRDSAAGNWISASPANPWLRVSLSHWGMH
jgi:hypothetical protein